MPVSTVDDDRRLRRTALGSVLAALALVVIKLATGLAVGSLALVAEALHSAADLVAAMLTLVAVRVAQRPPDRRHPWGHGRAEHLAALAESTLLLTATAAIAWRAASTIIDGESTATAPWWSFATVAVVIGIDAWRTTVSLRAARRHDSPALASNALHFAGDLGGSIAVLIGLGLVRAGIDVGDAMAALVVATIVAAASLRLLWDNAQVLMDVAPEGAERSARRAIARLDLPITLIRLRVRRSAGRHLADVVIGVPAIDHVAQGHAHADAVEAALHEALPGSDVVVHVEPETAGTSVRDVATAAALSLHGIREVHNVAVLLVEDSIEVSMHLKVDGDLPLSEAHSLADRVEDRVRLDVPGVTHVDVHIEPIGLDAISTVPIDDRATLERASAVAEEVTGHPPRSLRLRRLRTGVTAYVTVVADAAVTLREAHDLATLVEAELCARVAAIDEAVVHTEPAAATELE